MPEPVKVLKADLVAREATDAEQAIINDRISKGEPAFDEEREGFVPPEEKKKLPEEELKSKAKELGLTEDATAEDIAAKEKETADTKLEELKKRAVELGLSEDATEEDITAKEAEKAKEDDADPQKVFDKADAVEKEDLIAELELEMEKENDEAKKKEMQATLDKWNKVVAEPDPKEKEKTVDEEITEYAKEKNVSEDIAREVIEGRDAVIKKYEGNPKKLAHALRSLQSEYSKDKKALVDTAKALEQARIEVMMSSNIKPEEILRKPDGSKLTKDECIEAYRDSYPGQCDNKDDDEVYDLQRKHVLSVLHQNKVNSQATVKADAKVKRVELMANLPKEAEPYRDSIKKMLDTFPDGAVAQEGFDLEEIILVHKGRDIDKLVKEAEKRGFKRGLEKKRVLGEMRQPGGKVRTNTDVKGDPKSHGLSEEMKKEALVFFKDNNIPDQRKFELFADMKKKEKELVDKRSKK